MNISVLNPVIKITPATGYSISQVNNAIDDFEEKRPSTFKLNLQPSYQRGEAWNKDFMEMLIYSLITNYPIGNFIFRELDNPSTSDTTHEVVDGQQRLRTIREFIKGSFSLSPDISRHIVKENENSYLFDVQNNINPPAIRLFKKYMQDNEAYIRISFSNLPSTIQVRILNNYPLNVVIVRECSEEAITQYFRFIQNQERLRAGEIINAIPDSPLTSYLERINNKEDFIRKINWNESRKEFEKIFYSMAGIFDKKLNFGTTDNAIIDYVASFKAFSNGADSKMELMIDSINAITLSCIKSNGKFSKRLLKFLLLTSGFGIIDYTRETDLKFSILLKIEEKLPSFNSETEKVIKKVFPNYPEEIVNIYRELFILGRGSHSSDSTYQVLKKIVKVFKYELELLDETRN